MPRARLATPTIPHPCGVQASLAAKDKVEESETKIIKIILISRSISTRCSFRISLGNSHRAEKKIPDPKRIGGFMKFRINSVGTRPMKSSRDLALSSTCSIPRRTAVVREPPRWVVIR